ncbi:uncharacterized protein LOC143259177 [Megalopta genalis]|uniref:uncharacterized protein LOC143259177 n=1 Tax=Megalopta genalis TaxID=115081 RepID=UPI003FD34BDE
MDMKAVVVSGEAPESDDDSANVATGMEFSSTRNPNYCGTIISGEAPESDDDGTSLSSISGAVDAIACMPYTDIKIPKSKKYSIRYNSLLHKKLYECNKTLDKDLVQMIEGTIDAATQDLSCVNRQLLKSELILQEAVCQLRSACIRTKDTSSVLHQLMDVNFLHSVKT